MYPEPMDFSDQCQTTHYNINISEYINCELSLPQKTWAHTLVQSLHCAWRFTS